MGELEGVSVTRFICVLTEKKDSPPKGAHVDGTGLGYSRIFINFCVSQLLKNHISQCNE